MTHVAIAIATYRRPEGLRRLVNSLEALRFQAAPPRITLIIIDNDSASTETRPDITSSYDTVYRIEPVKGLASVRNACLDALPGDADWLAFVDDDEWVAEHWLESLLAMQARSGADIVQGVVRPVYPGDAPTWMREGGYHEVGPFEDGARLTHGASGNVLIRASAVREPSIRFHADFNASGGEDVDFFQQLLQRGLTMVAANDAIAWEEVPPDRMTWRWVLRRRFRTGHTLGLVARRRGGVPQRAVKAVGRLVRGVALAMSGLATSRSRLAKGVTDIAWGAGSLVALIMGRPFRRH